MCLLNCNVIINTGFKGPPVRIGSRSISFCLSVTIRLTKKQPMEIRSYVGSNLGVPSIIVGEAWQPECEEADHTASTIRKQKEMNTQVPFSFYSDLKPSPQDGATHN